VEISWFILYACPPVFKCDFLLRWIGKMVSESTKHSVEAWYISYVFVVL